MPRYVLDVAYDGTRFSGWQMQPNAVSVQEELHRVMQTVLKVPVYTYGAGRTDAGVHAIQMPAHFDYDGELHPQFLWAMNAILPPDIAVTRVYKAPTENFHARYSARWRAYRYQITFQKNPRYYQRAFWVKGEPLDTAAMQLGAEIIMEYDSFESFCKSQGSNKTYFCKLKESRWEVEDDLFVYHVKADRFLRGMVRTIVGTLLLMGKREIDEQGLRDILESKDRRRAGQSVSPCGLYLRAVGFEGDVDPLEQPQQRLSITTTNP